MPGILDIDVVLGISWMMWWIQGGQHRLDHLSKQISGGGAEEIQQAKEDVGESGEEQPIEI